MKIRTLAQVNDRTVDGRTWSNGEGVERDVDDADANLVALMRNLSERGFVEIVKEEPKKADPKKAEAPKTARRPE